MVSNKRKDYDMAGTPEGKVKVYGVISEATNKKIVEFAERFEVSQTKMVTIMLETIVENDEWLIKAVTSKFAKRLYKAFGLKPKKDDLQGLVPEV